MNKDTSPAALITADIAIPVLDEEESLEFNVVKILDFIDGEVTNKYSCRIVIADNGSTDSTPEIARALSRDYTDKVGYQRVDRRGVGLALKHVWASSDADIVGYMDLDLATDLRHLQQALDAIAECDADIVYGTRLHPKSEVVGRTVKRELISKAFNTVLKNYLGIHFSDGMCGFKFLKSKHVRTLIDGGAVSDGWFFCTEILVVAEWAGLSLYELPVRWTDSPDSKVNILKLTKDYLKAMKELKRNRRFTT